MARGSLVENGADEVGQMERREGSIVRVRMKDFVTYDSVECVPGESLNVVIGPNGTGKSTILCAIVLGLGGKPAHLGKQNTSIQDFIKSNHREAQIEIELYRHRKNSVIKRTIHNDGKSIWHLNGRQVNLKDIEAETKALNIQIDNLCQVLAQDRVQDFAKLNKQELLEATQKAVGKEGMSEIHANLKNLQKRQKDLEQQLVADKHRRDQEQEHVERLKGAVEKMERRRGIEEEAEACRLKMSLMEYKSKLEEVKRFKELKKEAEKNVDKIKVQIEPFTQKIAEAESKHKEAKKKQNGMERRLAHQSDAVKEPRDQLESIRHEILELEVDLEKRMKQSVTQLDDEAKVRQTISKFKNDINSLEGTSEADNKNRCKQLKQEMAQMGHQIQAAENKRFQIDNEISDLQNQLNDVNRQISKLNNVKETRLRQLNEFSPDAYQAALWVEKNRGQFRAPVYLPMMVELDVNPTYARYAENAIGQADLIAFVCENKEDMKDIVDVCRKQKKLRVNVLHADPDCPPSRPQYSFDQVKAQFPQFHGYLIDYIKGPTTLLNFLCNRKRFNNIPVTLSEVEASDTFTLYYSGDLRKGHQRSNYQAGQKIYFSDFLNRAKFFSQNTNDADKDTLQQSAAEFNTRIAQKQREADAVKQKTQSITEERENKRNEVHKLERAETTLQNTKFRLAQKEKELVTLERNRVNPDVIKANFSSKVKAATLKLINAQENLYSALKQLDSHVVENQLIGFEVQAARSLVEKTKQSCAAEKELLRNAEADLESIGNEFAKIRTDATKQLHAIEKKNSNRKPNDIWVENEALFSTLPNTIEELETHIEDKLAHAQMLGGGNDDVIRQFEGHVRTLDQLQVKIADKEEQTANLVRDMENRENQWRQELNELVDAISSNFSRYFKEMKCAGQVDLFTGNSEHDYDNYGLRVRVKFRDNEDLQDLNAHTQSGGERAVSTAIYMLALQELTPAPFRLVDEINQGMDSKNERRVYELLLRSTSRPGTPQYFLLTPKLLKDMEYNPGTTVLCVMNSACAPSHKAWDLNKFIELANRANA
ncbi:structural maintenance of chromosomes protein 5 [Thrips palmi]|uniref:Structural maintenance of chromosomes protein 5 n=1 Tax=Thrips palmi TaxID=161013 RepID=A0A6P8YBN9_THRPL|nr:structural maintenance of chromosomes protein 5 [Thrips palmi]